MQAIEVSEERPHHAAFGLDAESLNIVVVDPSRTMQTILRSMLQALKPKRVRMYDSPSDALRDMLIEPPNLVMTDWKMSPVSGQRFVKIMRHQSMAPLCFVPIVVVTGHATRSTVEGAFRAGVQAVMVKPLSPEAMRRRLDWLVRDGRGFAFDGEAYVIEGVAEQLDIQREKLRLPSIIEEMKAAEAISAPLDTSRLIESIMKGEIADGARAEDLIAERAKRVASGGEDASVTLDRLIRIRRASQRKASEVAEAPSASNLPASQATKKARDGKTRTRWADIWSS